MWSVVSTRSAASAAQESAMLSSSLSGARRWWTPSRTPRKRLVRLPREAEPLLLHYDPSLDPVMGLASPVQAEVSSTRGRGAASVAPLAELRVKRQIEPIKGVAAAGTWRSGRDSRTDRRGQVQHVNLSIGQVLGRLRAEHRATGGRIRRRRWYMIRTINEYQNLRRLRTP